MNSNNMNSIIFKMPSSNKDEDKRNFFIDPSKGKISKSVDYNAKMYMIDTGENEGTCIVQEPSDEFRINPNVKDYWKPSEETYMLNPKSNQIMGKWELEQKQQLKIYPHMFSAHTELMKQEKPWKGGIEYGGVDYPIPMRFQLRHLQQPPPPCEGDGIDYDIHVKPKNNERPDEINYNDDKYLNVPGGVNRCNIQKTKPNAKSMSEAGTVAQLYDTQFNQELKTRDTLRNKIRNEGAYNRDKEWLEKRHYEREAKQNDEIRNQPLYSNMYKGVPRIGETISTRNQPQATTRVTGAAFPSGEAQKSSFFGLGPPLPPPNPELLSAVNSELLAKPNSTGHSALDKSIIAASTTEEERKNILQLQEQTEKSALRREQDVPVSLGARHGSIIHQKASVNSVNNTNTNANVQLLTDFNMEFTSDHLSKQLLENFRGSEPICSRNPDAAPQNIRKIQDEQQLLPEPSTPLPPSQLIENKIKVQRRIEYQIAQLDRLLPLVRQKQVYAKDNSHTIDIHKTTNKISQIEKMTSQLRLMHDLISEEIQAIQKTHPHIKIPTVPSERLTTHYFGNLPLNVGMFYSQNDFQGSPVELGYGMYDYPLVGGVGNNALRSFKIPKNSILYLYTRPKKQGIRLKYSGPMRVNKLPEMYSRQISCIELINSTPSYEAMCYTGPTFQGREIALKVGVHDFPSVGGLGNHGLASFRIPERMIMTIYSRPGKQGDKLTYIGPIEVPTLPMGWIKNVSGIEVQLKK
jgi:hypothetical protein